MSSVIKDHASFCVTCQLQLPSRADYAIHEFSKKHCDNIIRLSKNKPIKKKEKKIASPESKDEKPTEASNICTESGNFALYGYFDANQPTEPTDGYKPREYNYEYDPYLQKLAEDPTKSTAPLMMAPPPLVNVSTFSRNKKKKIRTCQICNVTLMNVPEYDAHMKSYQHSWKLKMTGMGVSAHFVKASTDLHTTDKSESMDTGESTSGAEATVPVSVPLAPSELFCDVCEMQLNSTSQYEVHVSGKSHKQRLASKVAATSKKETSAVPQPDKLFCYTCTLSLQTLAQFKDHINGKKHKIKCRNAVRDGFSIPPEERVPDMWWAIPRPGSTVKYPSLYEQTVQTSAETQETTEETSPVTKKPIIRPNTFTGMYHCRQCHMKCGTAAKLELHAKTHSCIVAQKPVEVEKKEGIGTDNLAESSKDRKPVEKISADPELKCTICEKRFRNSSQFEVHLNSEEHAQKIVDMRKCGESVSKLFDTLMVDRGISPPDRFGRFHCGICAVMVSNFDENKQHLSSVVHKYAELSYRKRRLLEIKEAFNIDADDEGLYTCKLCSDKKTSLVDFNSHLHGPLHKSTANREYYKKMAGKRGFHLHGTRRIVGLRCKDEKNPGFRTKVGGTAVNLNSGTVEAVPNLETIEPRIDVTKNVALGLPKEKYVAKESNYKSRYMERRGRSTYNFNYPRNSRFVMSESQYRPPYIPSAINYTRPSLMSYYPQDLYHQRYPPGSRFYRSRPY